MASCAGCGTLLPEGKAYCPKCGLRVNFDIANRSARGSGSVSPPRVVGAPGSAPLNLACAACGADNPPGAQFCQACGVLLGPAANRPPAGPVRVTPGGPVPDPVAPPVNRPAGYFQMTGGAAIAFPTGRTEFLIGRSDPIQGFVPDLDLGPYITGSSGISRQHARITKQNNQHFLEDLHSTNFTFLNDRQVLPGHLYPLQSGDRLQFGQIQVVYISLE